MVPGPIQETIDAWTRVARARGVTHPGKAHGETGTPQAASWFVPAVTRHGPGHELVVILRTRGCSHHYSPAGGCTVCGYNNDSTGHVLDAPAITTQFSAAMQQHAGKLDGATNVVLKIFNSGSFFDDDEIPATARDVILACAKSHPSITSVAVESRPEHVSHDAVRRAKDALPASTFFEVGIGLETWNDGYRQDLLNKGFTLDDFLRAHRIIQQASAGTKVYLFLKPPFLSERDALDDVVRSAREVGTLDGVSTISINPAAIHAHTVLERMFNEGYYRTPWLYTVRVALHQVLGSLDPAKKIQVLCDPVAGGKHRGAVNCRDRACNEQSLDLVKQATGAGMTFEGLDPTTSIDEECTCVLEWLDEIDG